MSKRVVCSRCERPESVCICQWLQPVSNSIPICILRHKKEKKHPLNTVKILDKCLENCTIVDGENFDLEAQYLDFIHQNRNKNIFILYPDPEALTINEISEISSANLAFIILDGTWRKTKLIRYETQSLSNYPCVALPTGIKSEYILRKTPENGVSTLEATVELLNNFNDQPSHFDPLLNAFREMINLQVKHIDQDVFKRNYHNRLK